MDYIECDKCSPCTVKDFCLAVRRSTSCDVCSYVVFWIRAVFSCGGGVHWIVPILHLTCNTGRPGGGGELVFRQAGEVVGVHVVVGH